MMRAHIAIFSFFLAAMLSYPILYCGFKIGLITFQQYDVSYFGVAFFSDCTYFIFNEFVAYLILRFSDSSKELYAKILAN